MRFIHINEYEYINVCMFIHTRPSGSNDTMGSDMKSMHSKQVAIDNVS